MNGTHLGHPQKSTPTRASKRTACEEQQLSQLRIFRSVQHHFPVAKLETLENLSAQHPHTHSKMQEAKVTVGYVGVCLFVFSRAG